MVFLEGESNKSDRILFFYDRLLMGDSVSKNDLAQHFDVNERTIRRDVQDIRYYLARFYTKRDIIYDPITKGYKLIWGETGSLKIGEIVALSKVILESRILDGNESKNLIVRLESYLHKAKPRWFEQFIEHELMNYRPKKQTVHLFGLLDLAVESIVQKRKVKIIQNRDNKKFEQSLCPVGLAYKNLEFYLAVLPEKQILQKSEIRPISVRLDKNLTMKREADYFTLPISFSFDEEAFKKCCDSLHNNI